MSILQYYTKVSEHERYLHNKINIDLLKKNKYNKIFNEYLV